MIIVFLDDKLLSCDTIVPFCVHYKMQHPGEKFWFYCTSSQRTADIIRRNIVLSRAMDKLGGFSYIGNLQNPFSQKGQFYFKRTRKIAIALNLLWTLFYLVFLNAKVIHFKYWDHRLLKIFTKVVPDRFVYFHSNCWGDNPYVDAANRLDRPERVNTTLVSYGRYVTFHDYWGKYLQAKSMGLPVILSQSTRSSNHWLNFLSYDCKDLIDTEKKRIGFHETKAPITIVSNTLHQATKCATPDTPGVYLRKTLDILWRLYPDRPVLIKPHVITDMDKLSKIIAASEHGNTHISFLHTGLLGRMSSVAICNLFSLAMADCWLAECPTIEFTRYNNAVLSVTEGQSFGHGFIDVFTCKEERFAEEVERLVKSGDIVRSFDQKNKASADELVSFVAR